MVRDQMPSLRTTTLIFFQWHCIARKASVLGLQICLKEEPEAEGAIFQAQGETLVHRETGASHTKPCILVSFHGAASLILLIYVLWKSRVGTRNCSIARWFVVRTVLYRHGRTGMATPNRSRPHGFRYRPEQRRSSKSVFHRRERDDRRKHLRRSWGDWDWRSGPSEFGPPRPDVFVL